VKQVFAQSLVLIHFSWLSVELCPHGDDPVTLTNAQHVYQSFSFATYFSRSNANDDSLTAGYYSLSIQNQTVYFPVLSGAVNSTVCRQLLERLPNIRRAECDSSLVNIDNSIGVQYNISIIEFPAQPYISTVFQLTSQNRIPMNQITCDTRLVLGDSNAYCQVIDTTPSDLVSPGIYLKPLSCG